eukprot:UN09126
MLEQEIAYKRAKIESDRQKLFDDIKELPGPFKQNDKNDEVETHKKLLNPFENPLEQTHKIQESHYPSKSPIHRYKPIFEETQQPVT